MEYGDAHVAVLFNVGVPDVCDHFEFGGPQRVLFGENEVALEEPALVQRVWRADDQDLCCEEDTILNAVLHQWWVYAEV